MFKCCLGYENKKCSVLPIDVDKSSIKITNKNNLFEQIEFTETSFSSIFLGSGLSSTTYKIKLDDVEYTCKKTKKSFREDIINEVSVLKSIRGTNNLPYIYKAIETPLNYYIIYKHIRGKDLEQYLRDSEPLKTKKVACITYEILNGLSFLFSHNFVHLDIKLENIIIKETPNVKITLIDLAFCQRLNNGNKLEYLCGTIGYCPPEVLLHKRYSYNSDIWSLGIVVYNLLTKYELFTSKTNIYKCQLSNYEDISNFERAKLNLLSVDEIDLLDNMLKKLPFNRYSIKDVMNHNFIKNNCMNINK
tara:strand:- start:813 stop:1724 length:912 start_codon:yes stop_codon:yes gene_type:complete